APVAAELGLQLLALLLAHHVELQLDRADAVDLGDGVDDVPTDGVLHRAAGHCEIDADPHRAVRGDVDALDHAEVGDGAPDLGVDDGGEGGRYLFLGWCHRSLGTPG